MGPPPFLVDSEGDPYPTHIQRFVRCREQLSERDGLVPIGPEPSFQAPHQHQPIEQPQEPDEDDEADEGPPNETPEQRLARFRNEILRNLPAQQQQDQLAAEANGEGQGEAAEAEAEANNVTAARTTKLVLLKENTVALEI